MPTTDGLFGSLAVMNYALSPEGPTRYVDKLVLITIGSFLSKDADQAWPSMASIVARSHLGEATVRRSLRRLKKDGYLSLIEGRGAGKMSLYKFHKKGSERAFSETEKRAQSDPFSTDANTTEKGPAVTEKRAQSDPKKGPAQFEKRARSGPQSVRASVKASVEGEPVKTPRGGFNGGRARNPKDQTPPFSGENVTTKTPPDTEAEEQARRFFDELGKMPRVGVFDACVTAIRAEATRLGITPKEATSRMLGAGHYCQAICSNYVDRAWFEKREYSAWMEKPSSRFDPVAFLREHSGSVQ